MSTIPVVERLVLVRLVHATVFLGVRDRNKPEHFETLHRLEKAMDWELEALPPARAADADRHATKNANLLLQPLKEAKMDCAKFALVMFYVINELVEEGVYPNDNPYFFKAMETLVGHESNVSDVAAISGVDASAQKQSRKLLNAIRSLGYFPAERVA